MSSLRDRVTRLGLSEVGVVELREAIDRLKVFTDATEDVEVLKEVKDELEAIPTLIDRLLEFGLLELAEQVVFSAMARRITRQMTAADVAQIQALKGLGPTKN